MGLEVDKHLGGVEWVLRVLNDRSDWGVRCGKCVSDVLESSVWTWWWIVDQRAASDPEGSWEVVEILWEGNRRVWEFGEKTIEFVR